MISLRQRLAEHEAIRADLEAQGLDGQWLADMLEGETRLDEALLELAEVVAERTTHADACKARIAEIRDRIDRLESGADTIREAMRAAMERADMPKVAGALHTLSIGRGSPRVVLTDVAELPGRFLVPQPPKPDLNAVKAALKDGEAIPGAVLSNGAPSLTIRSK